MAGQAFLKKNLLTITLFLLNIKNVFVSRPPIFWDPSHKLFSCKDPIVNVKENDLLKFVCADKDISSKPNAHSSTLHEVAYLLDYTKEQEYENCDARDHDNVLLNCTSKYMVTQHRITQNALSPDAPSFTPGKTYYVIAPSYRTSNMINNMVGGSCNDTSDGGYHLKLKVHVCTDQEIQDGDCKLCESEGCYYEACGKQCDDWIDPVDNDCYKQRLCNNTLLNTQFKEYEKIDNCQTSNNPAVTTGKKTGEENNKDDSYKYMGIGIAFALIVGLVLGLVISKWHYGKKRQENFVDIERNNSKHSHINEGFQYDNRKSKVTN